MKFKDVVRVKFSPVNKLVRLNYKELCNWSGQLRLIDSNSCFVGYEPMAVFKLSNEKMERLPLAQLVILLNREIVDYVTVNKEDHNPEWKREDGCWLACKNSKDEKIGRFRQTMRVLLKSVNRFKFVLSYFKMKG